MYFQFKFSNLLGTVYRKGDIVFSKDGNSVYVPVGNKITQYDLRYDRSSTLPVEVTGNFTSLTLSPNGLILIGASDLGHLHMISVMRRRLLYTKVSRRPIRAVAFSPDSKYLAVARSSEVHMYRCHGMERRVFNPFETEKVCPAATSDVTCLSWSWDSRLVVFGSKDAVTRVVPVKLMDIGRQVVEISCGSSSIRGVHFIHGSYDFYVISKSGNILRFRCNLNPDELHEKIVRAKSEKRQRLKEMLDSEDCKDVNTWKKEHPAQNSWLSFSCDYRRSIATLLHLEAPEQKAVDTTTSAGLLALAQEDQDQRRNATAGITATCYHSVAKLLVVACDTGDFAVMDTNDECAVLHSLNVSSQVISSVALNLTGDWLALGVPDAGQLLVWELRSETYKLKQQGHRKSMTVVAYSPDGSRLASGGEDCKVKLWCTVSSFCFVTFSEHTAPVTGVVFTQSGGAVLSSSEDGELVAAGGKDCHQIYIFSLKLGSLLEVLSGHKGPVTSICFSSVTGSSFLASTALDGSLKLWDSINTSSARETIDLHADGVCVQLRPDGEQVCVSTMDGQLNMFNTSTAAHEGCIEGRRDMGLLRKDTDQITAEKMQLSKYFRVLCYSSDGHNIVAGGESRHVCIYSAVHQLLVKKFTITKNRTMDGALGAYDRFSMAHNGINMNTVERRTDGNEVSADRGIKLPGVAKGDKSLRAFRNEILVSDIAFAPTGRSFVVCCSEGLLIYSQDTDWLFDPVCLDTENTPSAVRKRLLRQEWSMALMMAIKLNISTVKQEVLESIPVDAMNVVLSGLAPLYVEGLLQHLAQGLENTRHVGLYARWARQALYLHGRALKTRAPQIISAINALHRALNYHHASLSKLCAANEFTLAYLRQQGAVLKHRKQKQEESDQKPEDVEMTQGNNHSNGNLSDDDGNDDNNADEDVLPECDASSESHILDF
ncbi:Small-subunit processome Utp12 [Trinorchestia longiramus]|nr:Small-subunit processome Utp12 [Trinorchestia longiramus]